MKYISTTIICIIIYIILSHYVYGLQITEIMFNPEGADTGREWIEITLSENEGCINFTEYKLFEENTNHNIYKYDYNQDKSANYDIACKYIIISSDVNKFLQDYTYLNNTDANLDNNITIYKSSFNLKNDGGYVAIKKDSNILDDINYTLLIENVDVTEGHSLEYYFNFWRNSILLKGDPGDLLSNNTNNNINNSNEENIINNTITVNETTTNITTNITINNITENVTDNQSNSLDYQKCNLSINILLKNTSMVYENNVPIKFQNKIYTASTDNSTAEVSYTIEYWIEDLFGNIIKSKVLTNNQDEKSFTPKIDEADKILIIKNILRNYSVDNYSCDVSYNMNEKMILIKNSIYLPATQPKSSCTTTCPSCSSKTQTSSSSKCPDNYLNYMQNTSSNASNALIKIINVCNGSKAGNVDNVNSMQSSLKQNDYGLNQILEPGISKSTKGSTNQTANNALNNNITQNAGKTTGMIVYESPNVKNRVYALIGLILVGITCIFFVTHKIIAHKNATSKEPATESSTESAAESKR